MFLLTCPNCEHETRCKYARSGAVASCPSCRTRFDLNEFTLKVERESEDLFAPWKSKTTNAQPAPPTQDAPMLIQQLSEASGPARSTVRRGRPKRRFDAALMCLNVAAVVIVGVALWWTLRIAGVWPSPAATIAAPVQSQPDTAETAQPAERSADGEPAVAGESLPAVRFIAE